ncbi:hypothetical protein NPIL_644301 [Nephila pilipes]|uniref:Uncharacterized protein n=1 Tax=Nephila pilipes TaxID=299642 RepID=A0A8X6PDP0_NEPPI|nr:hypothetical protein NPIL_644301 [Nephila pilipes]
MQPSLNKQMHGRKLIRGGINSRIEPQRSFNILPNNMKSNPKFLSMNCFEHLYSSPKLFSSKLITTNRQSTETAKQASNSIKKLVTLEDSADSLASYFSPPVP